MTIQFIGARLHVTGTDGDPLAGGFVYTYESGTTNPKICWSDAAKTAPKTNPFVLDAYGESDVWLDGVYKIYITDADGIGLPGYPVDYIPGSAVSAVELAGAAGAALVGFKQDGLNAVATTVALMLKKWYHVHQWGITGSGDETVKLQNALDEIPTGAVLDTGDMTIIASALSITRPLSIMGNGKASSVWRTNAATGAFITITTDLPVNFYNMTIGSTVTRTAGAYISFDATTGYNTGSVFSGVNFQAPRDGIDFKKNAQFTLERCHFNSYTGVAVRVANTVTPDAGDSSIYDCLFQGDTGGVGIEQRSSGGLKVQFNKFIDGSYHYLGSFNSAPSMTSILLFQNNSTEAASVANIAFNASAATTFGRVQIQNNEIAVNTAATGISFVDPGYAYMSDAFVSGNNFVLSANCDAMAFARISALTVGRNTINGNSSGERGLVFGAGVTAEISPQTFTNVPTRYAGTLTNVTFNPRKTLDGTSASFLSNVAQGPLYSTAIQTITYATPFPKLPAVTATAIAGNGAVSAIILNEAVGSFQYYIIGTTNGGSVSMRWAAHG